VFKALNISNVSNQGVSFPVYERTSQQHIVLASTLRKKIPDFYLRTLSYVRSMVWDFRGRIISLL